MEHMNVIDIWMLSIYEFYQHMHVINIWMSWHGTYECDHMNVINIWMLSY